MSFHLDSTYSPSGDQAQAIAKLNKSLDAGNKHQALLGVTGSGKTFTLANIIAHVDKPTLVISHNKTLAAQLYSELKSFFPRNAVEYYVSYFDYYQPEAYIARSDTYIEKDSAINDEIDRLSISAMTSLITRRDVIVVASVSCIYGLAAPEDYCQLTIALKTGMRIDRDDFLKRLVVCLYERKDYEFQRGTFRVRGEVVEVYPSQSDGEAIRIEFFGDEIERISLIDATTGRMRERLETYAFFPAKQYVSPPDKRALALQNIREELNKRVTYFESQNKLLEAQRLRMRTEYDLELIQELGFCKGIENYSRHLSGRAPGSAPSTLLNFFGDDFLTLIDESHAAVPQIGGMYEGDRSRKNVLVEHGFRLPSALDNRPLRFAEFMAKQKQIVYASATPGPFELINCRVDNKTFIPVKRAKKKDEQAPEGFTGIMFNSPKDIRVAPSPSTDSPEQFDPTKRSTPLIVEQIIRPTGLLEPTITLKPLKGQIDTTIELCHQKAALHQRVLVTTLTKKTAEDLTEYLKGVGIRVSYIHADVDAIERVEILRALRARKIDVLVGINLLREGLDLPEVSLVCILDADKEGFLRNETSLIQTAGRAARHLKGECILFCDIITDSIRSLIDLTNYRREIQKQYNKDHGITPASISRSIQTPLKLYDDNTTSARVAEEPAAYGNAPTIAELEHEMKQAAAKLEFERAAIIRDQITLLKKEKLK
ncbi:MAG: excinuclease ABC subunit UvrB [Akkermansia sp.]